MSARWAARVPLSQAAAAARLRLVPRIRVLAVDPWLWLRGETLDESLDLQLRSTPGVERFVLGDDDLLTPVDRRVPVGRLPEGTWQPLADWLTVELPPSRLAGQCDTRVPLRIVRSPDVREAGLLLTTWDAWHAYGISAPQVRLDAWMFAVADGGRTVVRGSPPPPIPGIAHVDMQGIAVPCGWHWAPPLDTATVRTLLGIDATSVALFDTEGTWERIGADQFVRASRSALRATEEAMRQER
ncbi:MAG: hypothetical protein IT428_14750 [Planctomycetaceae bacterium]|nr:hypothetical protein [Planctomycetaceae bacterium]